MDTDNIRTVLANALGDKLQTNIPLMNYTTMRVGGVADFLYEADSMDNLMLALHICFDHSVPYLIIASGSNVIASDAGFPGLAIINRAANISFIPEKSQVIVDSGCVYARLITEAATRGFGGLEWWFGLPGSIGGAVHNNAETWGHDMSEVVSRITLLFPPVGEDAARVAQVDVDWMRYAYRTSRLKAWHGSGKPVILTITLQLHKRPKEEIMRKMKQYKQGRWDLNQPKGVASAGSFFKNPGGSSHDESSHNQENSAGWLLEQSGAKKMSVGQAAVSPQHANFLINHGKASAQNVRDLAHKLKTAVHEKYGTELEEEVEYIGVWPENQQNHTGRE